MRRPKSNTKSKMSKGLEAQIIIYGNRRYPHTRHQQLKVDIRCGEMIDNDYAAAIVAARIGLALADVVVIKVTA